LQKKEYPIESLLSARHLLVPQLVDGYLYFLSNMSGAISLYRMETSGSLPELLLPSGLALQNPHLMVGASYVVFPGIRKILVMIDNDGDENYQPSFIPLSGGMPENIFEGKYHGEQLACVEYDTEASFAYFHRDDRKTPNQEAIQVDLKRMKETSLGKSIYGNFVAGTNTDHSKIILGDGYTANDTIAFLWTKKSPERKLLYGTPIEKREQGKEYPPTGFNRAVFINNDKSLLLRSTLVNDEGSPATLDLDNPEQLREVRVKGIKHSGKGELEDIRKAGPGSEKLVVQYNIDGCTWIYEGRLRGSKNPVLSLERTVVGRPPVDQGVVLGIEPFLSTKKRSKKGFAFSLTKATSPSQLYLFNSSAKNSKSAYTLLSSERILGIPDELLSPGEDASYSTFDGLRISARLYLPNETLGFPEPYPLVLYVHGGPQGQERPDFTWFSMPLIQYLTLNGIAVFVPNVRGSSGYGQKFMKMVDHDWGGKDRLDLVEGLKILERNDRRIDSTRRGVIGRSYGGYMTLTLVSRHPDLWKAGVDMFGPYNLSTFVTRLPESWRTYFYLAIGHPDKDKAFLDERSPSTYIDDVKCAMMMIQGRNDPRVVERETRDVVERLRARGIPVEYLVFEDEGHDVIKFKNRVICYTKIAEFFAQRLGAESKTGALSQKEILVQS
jgi:acetyl esterase/lipase